MIENTKTKPGSILFIPHGAGPLPLLDDESQQELIRFLQQIPSLLIKPSAILVISAHWEEKLATITHAQSPSLIYDYSGFPEAAYAIEYPARGEPVLAHKIFSLLQQSGIEARLSEQRGFDHGLFVPLKLMFPEADIPCVQLSLLNNLDPLFHINIGRALSQLAEENILILGSGFSFHNLRAFFARTDETEDLKNEIFEDWLIDTCTDDSLTVDERLGRLINWDKTAHARYCHPREEHLLPLLVCCGMSKSAAQLVFDGRVMGKKTSALLW